MPPHDHIDFAAPLPLVDMVTDAPLPTMSLADSATQGVKWSFIGTVASQLARLGTSFLLARILGPNDFGVVALAYVYLALVSVLIDQAFGALVVQRPTLSRDELATVTAINAGIIAALTLATVVLAPFVADFFNEPELTVVLRVLSLSVVFGGLAAIPLGLLARDLRFADIAKIQLVSTFLSAGAAVGAALAGAGLWALVVQGLLAPGVLLVGGLMLAGMPVVTSRLVGLRSMVSFSAPLMGAQVLGFLGMYSDNLLIGRFKGAVQLAYYALAYRIMLAFMDVVTGVIGRVSLPLYSRAAADRDRLQRGFLLSVRAATTGSFGLLTLAILVAPVGIPLLLGDKWEPAVVPLQLLMAASFARVVMVMLAPLAMAMARTDLVLIWSAIVVGVTVLGFAVGLHWGINGVATGFLVASFLLVLPNTRYVGRIMGLDLRQFLVSVVPASVAAATMAASWLGVNAGLGAVGVGDVAAATVASVVGLGVYAVTLRWGFPRAFQDVWGLASGLFRRGATAAPAS